MKSLAVIVEGSSDKHFFTSLKPWFEELGFLPTIIEAQNRSRLIQDADKHVATAIAGGKEVILLVIDQDEDGCAPNTASKLSQSRNTGALIAVAAKCLEAWLLADEIAVRAASARQYTNRRNTDQISRPADALRDLFFQGHKQYFTKMEIVRRVSPRFDIERAASRNSSLGRMVDRLRSLA